MAALTHAELTAQLVAEGALAIAQGRQPEKVPVTPAILSKEERERLGVGPGELAVFYPVGDTGVFLQWGGPHALVWYAGADTSTALDTLDKALRKVKARKESDGPHKDGKGKKVRRYRLDLDAKRFVKILAIYPAEKRAAQEFIVQLSAQEKR